jgi:hypothetical protein
MKYLISYDLLTPGKNYDTLIAALTRMGARRVLLSQWVVRSSSTAIALRDHVKTLVDRNDRVLVTGMNENAWAAVNSMADINQV